MISSLHLNKLALFVIILIILSIGSVFGEEEPADIWKKEENEKDIAPISENPKKHQPYPTVSLSIPTVSFS